MVSSAIALIAVTNFCILRLLGNAQASPEELMQAVAPMALPASVAVILVMSALYHRLLDVMADADRRETELLLMAGRDPLTGIASRHLFDDRLSQALFRYRRTGEPFAVIMLDLDHFKRVNDLHGHQVGDDLLKQAAHRLTGATRDGDTVARFGGDEFLVLVTALAQPTDVRLLCARICAELQKPYALGSRQLRLPASLGAVISTGELREPSDYVRAADMALYEAKDSGRNCFRFFSDELDQRVKRRDLLETDLRSALRQNVDAMVHFQPQISSTGELTGVEALFRWTHPKFGEVPPAEAVEIAEESDLIERLGEFVFRKAAAFARTYPELSVAINLSAAQFSRSASFAQRLRELARQEGVEPSQIELEITERLFAQSGSGTESQIQELRSYGFRVALDDFGTGYSSLSHLRQFKVDRLKLDKSFAAADDVQDNIALIRAAISMAHLLNIAVVAEGIETELQEAIALESGCDALQGYRYGVPMSADQFAPFIAKRLRSAA